MNKIVKTFQDMKIECKKHNGISEEKPKINKAHNEK